MEEIQVVVFLFVIYWFAEAENRQALILKRIQKAHTARFKARQCLLLAIADSDWEMAETNAR